MNGTEVTLYSIACVLLAASCAAFILSSRPTQHETRFTSHAALLSLLAPWLAAIAFLALTIGLALRGMAARRWPIGSPFEFKLAFAASVVLLYLLLRRTAPTPLVGAIATLVALLLLLQALLIGPETERAIQTLPPVMRGLWFSLHTLFTSIAYGALTAAGGVALTSIVIPELPMTAFVDRAMAVGYVALSLGMISGGIWGERAWGEYWSWSIKEAWTLVTWLACTFYYHVRHRRGWRGRRAMSIAVLTVIAVLVTFFLTPTLLHWTRLQRWRIY